MFRLSERKRFSDCHVGIFLPQTNERPIVEQKCAEALKLLRTYSPRYFDRVRMYADGILVLGEVRFAGRWLAAPKLIQLNQAWIVSADTNAMDVASTIVHEATYAWLESCGFTFAIGRRQRIEAICYRSEAEFARRIPDGEELSALYERCAQLVLEEGDAEWSDEALQARHAQELRELGAPEWLIKTFVRISP